MRVCDVHQQEEVFWGEAEGLAGAELWVQLEPVVGALMSLSLNYRGCLRNPTARNPRDDIISEPKLVEFESVTFG